jgi:hypothetical protein
MYKYPVALLLALASERCDASKWMFNIIFNLWYHIVTSGLVARKSKIRLTFSSLFSVALVCSLAIEMRAGNVVKSTAQEKYKMPPTTCCTLFTLASSTFLVSSSSIGLSAPTAYILGTA